MSMSITLIGKKRGMLNVFQNNRVLPCTAIEIKTNVISQVKTTEKDGYRGVQVSSIVMNASEQKKARKSDVGRFKKIGLLPRKLSRESRVSCLEEFPLGREITVEYFAVGEKIDATGISKGKGFQGAMKRCGKSSLAGSHGVGPVHRHMGSIGAIRGKGEVKPGKKMAGRLGGKRVTVESLKILDLISEKHVILVSGSVPGATNGIVFVRKAKKVKKKGLCTGDLQ